MNQNELFNFSYLVTLTEQKEGGYLVRIPGFLEAITQGEIIENLKQAADCLEEAIANRVARKLDIPKSTHKNSKYKVLLTS